MKLNHILKQIKKCTLCAEYLPLGPNPILRVHPDSSILIIGQAPGTKAHHSSTPWNDFSGDRLRSWLSLDRETFYNEKLISIMPMGFCYPGRDKNGGDKPPRVECAKTWHKKVREHLPNLKLTLLVGSYAQRYYLGNRMKPTLNETVRAWKEYLPEFIPLPHPSWRNTAWLRRNPWFEDELLPALRKILAPILRDKGHGIPGNPHSLLHNDPSRRLNP